MIHKLNILSLLVQSFINDRLWKVTFEFSAQVLGEDSDKFQGDELVVFIIYFPNREKCER